MHTTSPLADIIIAELCKRVGIKSIDTTQPNWFWKHTWTQEEQDDFCVWLAQKLKGRVTRGRELHEAEKVAANYGWKIKSR